MITEVYLHLIAIAVAYAADIRNAPAYEVSLWGNFTSSNGNDFSISCTNAYTTAFNEKARDMATLVNSLVGGSLCANLASDDVKIGTTTVDLQTYLAVGSSLFDFILASKNHLTFNDTMKCASEMSIYLQSHTNWGYPVIPSEPGCPGISFTKSSFNDQAQQWYCNNDIGLSLPNYVVPVVSNFTSQSGATITPSCSFAYGNQMERKSQDMVIAVNDRINVEFCLGISGLRIWREQTTLTTYPTGTSGFTSVSFYLQATNQYLSYNQVFACADEIGTYLTPHLNWGSPLLSQESGCPFLTFNPESFYGETMYWFCYTLNLL